jgi:hypothetical protein
MSVERYMVWSCSRSLEEMEEMEEMEESEWTSRESRSVMVAVFRVSAAM